MVFGGVYREIAGESCGDDQPQAKILQAGANSKEPECYTGDNPGMEYSAERTGCQRHVKMRKLATVPNRLGDKGM